MTTLGPNEGIELLYTRECTTWREALANLQQALKNLNIDAEPKIITIDTMGQAYEYNFFASPTINLYGVDIDPQARRVSRRGIGCNRPYFWDKQSYPVPPVKMIEDGLKELYK